MIDIAFVLALCVGTGAVDYMLDNPVAAVIAIGSLVILWRITDVYRKEC